MKSITQETAAENDADGRDVLGDRLTQLLNTNGAFHWRPAANPSQAQWTTPVLSWTNWMILQSRFKELDVTNVKKRMIWKGGKCWRSSLRFFTLISASFLVISVFLTTQLLLAASCSLVWVTWKSMSLLINWEELCATWCPLWIQKHVPAALKMFMDWVDTFLLAGRQFAGRDWTDEGILWNQPTFALFSLKESCPPSASWGKSLLEHPPPTSKQLGRRLSLDPHSVWTWMDRSRKENDPEVSTAFHRTTWSTAEHAVALHFCYTMLRDEQLHNDASKELVKVEKSRQQQSTLQILHKVQTSIGEEPTNIIDSSELSVKEISFERSIKEKMSKTVASHHFQHKADPNFVQAMDSTCHAEAVEVKVTLQDSFESRQEQQNGSVPVSLTQLDEMSFASNGSVRSETSDVEADLPWIDVGAKIGMRFLNSAQAQRSASSDDNAEICKGTGSTIKGVGEDEGATPGRKQLHKPIHPMWTSTMSVPLGSPANEENSEIPSKDPNKILHSPSRTKKIDSATPFPAAISSVENLVEHRDANEPTLIDPTIMRDSTESLSGFSVDYVIQEDDIGVALVTSENGDVEASQFLERPAAHARRQPLSVGVKVAIPITPCQPGMKNRMPSSKCQMGTVVHSQRILLSNNAASCGMPGTNAISVTCKLDRCFLRNGEFSELTFRVKDEWKDRYMPRHSKVPIGSCVSTSFGVGVLVGWRVEDDCHVVRCLWQRRGDGSAHAYMNRDAIHGTIEAAVGFEVGTDSGEGVVVACIQGGTTFESPRFLIGLTAEGMRRGQVLELNRKDIRHCHGAQFIPVIEHIREAAIFQLQVDLYRAALREQKLDGSSIDDEDDFEEDEDSVWDSWQGCVEIIWTSFLRAVDENEEFDEGLNEFVSEIIEFLEGLDGKEGFKDSGDVDKKDEYSEATSEARTTEPANPNDSRFWLVNEVLGDLFQKDGSQEIKLGDSNRQTHHHSEKDVAADDTRKRYYERAFVILKVLMRTVSIARAESVNFPRFRLSLSILYEFLIFCRTIVKVQQKNSVQSLEVWKRAWNEIVSTFGPMKQRLERIGRAILHKVETQGRKAKTRSSTLVKLLLGDERLLIAIEHGDWARCVSQIERALLKAKILEETSVAFYRKTITFVVKHIQSVLTKDSEAASRNNAKLILVLKAVQSLASPRRSMLKFLTRSDVLELLERILMRTYYREDAATRMLNIHASNFTSLRHLRMLKDFSIAGRIWIPLLDAADEECSYLVSHLPENSKEFMCPISSLFSLCVAQFHKINAGDLSKDWLEFLLEEDSARIIQDLDMKLILSLEAFSKDVREMLDILPYYSSIDDDFLNLIDEVDLEQLLKDASKAMDESNDFSQFLREKATIAIERFLNYLPKLSIPVDRRDLGGDLQGWILTCRGEDGGDLTLSDVNIRRENLICQVMGGESIFFPMFSDNEDATSITDSIIPHETHDPSVEYVEESILDEVRDLILQAQRHGCWKVGVGGIGQPASDRYISSVLHDLPISSVLNCGIELWRNLEIDDDELMEIAIRDVSYQIELHKDMADDSDLNERHQEGPKAPNRPFEASRKATNGSQIGSRPCRFNPRIDPTILFLDMKNLKLHLDNFFFRIEKKTNRTIFDPVFEGRGMVSLQNLSIRLRIECAKDRVDHFNGKGRNCSPVLHLRELQVNLEKVKLRIKDTGFGSDWVLNQAVHVFQEAITKVVEENLKEQIEAQIRKTMDVANAYFVSNPLVFLNLLGISMDDLDDDNIVWV